MRIKKLFIVMLLAVSVLSLPPCVRGGGAGKKITKPVVEEKYPKPHFIEIEKEGVEFLAPGIGIEARDGKTRYYTVSHYFGVANDPGRYRIHVLGKVYPIIRVYYLGNDIVELFIEKERNDISPELPGVAPTSAIDEFDTKAIFTGLEKPFQVEFMGLGQLMVCFGSYTTNLNGRESRHGFVCDPGEKIIRGGNSGLPVADKAGKIFLLSGSADHDIDYQFEGKTKTAHQMVFIQPIPIQ